MYVYKHGGELMAKTKPHKIPAENLNNTLDVHLELCSIYTISLALSSTLCTFECEIDGVSDAIVYFEISSFFLLPLFNVELSFKWLDSSAKERKATTNYNHED